MNRCQCAQTHSPIFVKAMAQLRIGAASLHQVQKVAHVERVGGVWRCGLRLRMASTNEKARRVVTRAGLLAVGWKRKSPTGLPATGLQNSGRNSTHGKF